MDPVRVAPVRQPGPEHQVDPSRAGIHHRGRLAHQVDGQTHLLADLAARRLGRILAAVQQASGHPPPLPVDLAHQQDPPVGPLDQADGTHRERRREGAHRGATGPRRQQPEESQQRSVQAGRHRASLGPGPTAEVTPADGIERAAGRQQLDQQLGGGGRHRGAPLLVRSETSSRPCASAIAAPASWQISMPPR